MENTKVSRLLLAWLFTQGHKVEDYQEGEGLTTVIGGVEYKFDVSGGYGGYKVTYSSGTFSFYNGDELLKQTDLNEFR